jgi:hypothetical protein
MKFAWQTLDLRFAKHCVRYHNVLSSTSSTRESFMVLLLADSSLEHDPISKLELDEVKEDTKMEPVEVYKEGMVVPPREDGRPPEPPEGFTIHTTESGVMVLRRKRQRNLQKLGNLIFGSDIPLPYLYSIFFQLVPVSLHSNLF